MNRRNAVLGALVSLVSLTAVASEAPAQTPKPLTLVFVVDGLRPDSINATDTPTLFRLQNEGTRFTNSHSIVPTVTRGNATVMGTGAYPARSGILGNAMYWPGVNPTGSFSTGDANQLTKLDDVTGGKMVLVQSVAERVQAAGLKFLSLGSGTSGATLLLNPRAPKGVGEMVSTGDSAAPFAYPTALGESIIQRFGPPPSTSGQPNANLRVSYTERVLREQLLTAILARRGHELGHRARRQPSRARRGLAGRASTRSATATARSGSCSTARASSGGART